VNFTPVLSPFSVSEIKKGSLAQVDKNKVVIVGGGPAGMMAAISAGLSGKDVTIVERNFSLGRKLLLTGGGRCNLTNACEPEDLVDHFSRTGTFLRDAFNMFNNIELLRFFSENKLSTKTEEKGRVFPITDKALSVLNVLEVKLRALKINVLSGKRVKDVILDKNVVSGVLCTDGSKVKAAAVILATGGVTYKATGSTGDGIKIAERMGHRVVPLRPGLVSLELSKEYPGGLEGLSLNEVKLTFRAGKTRSVSGPDGLIFTERGISGPAVFFSSAKVIDWMNDEKEVSVDIDMMPTISCKGVEGILLNKLSASSGKGVKNIIKEIIPARLAVFLLQLAQIQPEKKSNQITDKERKRLVGFLKELRFNVRGGGSMDKARVTRGGVSVKDIDPRTMGSRKIKGLYFAGEMIDIDGNCGGFNLQAAFSTGYLAGL